MKLIRRILDTRARYERLGNFKDWWYDIFLQYNREGDYDRANYWRGRQVYEKGVWSTLFGAFLKSIRKE